MPSSIVAISSPSPLKFLTTLWPQDLPGCYGCLTQYASGTQTVFPLTRDGLQAAAQRALELRTNVGFSVRAHLPGINAQVQGTIKSAVYLSGIALELDIHEYKLEKDRIKHNYTRLAELTPFLEKLPEPTMVVRTPGGYHIYWLFQQPLSAQLNPQLVRKFYLWARQQLNREIDLAPAAYSICLRVPGTIHAKYGKEIKLERWKGPRHDPQYFTDLTQDIRTQPRPKFTVKSRKQFKGKFRTDARPEPAKFKKLLKNPHHAAIWNKKLPKTQRIDHSQSGYDFRLIIAALKQKWSLQETINLYIAYLRKHHEQFKGEQYFFHTYEKALASVEAHRKGGRQEGIPAYYPLSETFAIPEALQRQEQIYANWVNEGLAQKRTLIYGAPCGLGKTGGFITQVFSTCKAGQSFWEIYVPRHDLAQEIHKKISEVNHNLKVQVIAGRSYKVQGQPLCTYHAEAEDLSQLGYAPYPNLCKSGEHCCKYFQRCKYLQQYQGNPDIVIHVQQRLELPRTRIEFKDQPPIAIIIDESFWRELLQHKKICIERLQEDLGPYLAKKLQYSFAEDGTLKLKAWKSPETQSRCIDKAKELRKQINQAVLRPGKKPLLKHLSPAPTNALFFLDGLIPAISRNQTPQNILYDAPKEEVHIWNQILPTRLRQGKENIPLLILDAAANPDLLHSWFPQAIYIPLNVERNAIVTQVHDLRGSTSSLIKRAKLSKLGKQVNQWIQSYVQEHPHEKILIGGPLKVILLLTCPANASLVHFNAIRGLDCYKDYDTVIIMGRNQPPPEVVENYARGIYYDSEPLELTGSWTSEWRGYRMRNGMQAGVKVAVHADKRVQAILEQMREMETLQMIDRLRLIHNPTPKKVFLLCNIPLDLTIDRLVSWKELSTGGSRLQQAWKREGSGVLILQAKYLSQQFPDLWPTPMAVKMDFHQYAPVQAILQAHPEIKLVQFKLLGQRRWSNCLTCLADPKEQLAIHLKCKPVLQIRETHMY